MQSEPRPGAAAPAGPRPHTKIVATIGPASEERVGELIDAGMSVARLNFSHGSDEEHRRRVAAIRSEARARRCAVGILADLQGPKMRLGRFEGGKRVLQRGEEVVVREGGGVAAEGEVLFGFGGFRDALRPGHRMILADGMVQLVVLDCGAGGVTARVVRPGELADRKGVHLPDSRVEYELPTEEDRRHIALAREMGVDMLGVSFVGCADELREIRALAPDQQLVAKIERKAALDGIEGILAETDGVMVARGDLGVELELEQVPMAQKALIQGALEAGRFTITATEMLESMVGSSRPTRAEVADVANAVLDGTDAIMLSAETAIGRYPVEAVATMGRIAQAVEGSDRYRHLPEIAFRAADPDAANAIAKAAVEAADAMGITRIVCFTESGRTGRLLSRYRPKAEVIALSPNERAVAQMCVLAHVQPILFRREPSLEDMLFVASEMLVVRGLAEYGDAIVFVAGVPPGVHRSTNVLKLHRVGEEVRLH